MARGGKRKKARREADGSGEPTHALGRLHAGFLGTLVGAGGGAVFAMEWLEDFELLLPLAIGGGLVAGVLGAVFGDKIWETIVDWL